MRLRTEAALKILSPLLSILLAPLLAAAPLLAQLPAAGPGAEAVPETSLQIRVLGDGTKAVETGARSTQGLTAEVTDAGGASIPNAAVVFRLPDSGPSGTFADGTQTAIAYTDAQGQARAGDIRWGDKPGAAEVRVTAVKGTSHAGVLYEQTLAASVPAGATPIAIAPEAKPLSIPMQPAEPATPGALPVRKSSPGVVVEHRSSSGFKTDSAGADAPEGDLPGHPMAALDDSPDANVPVPHMLTTGAGEAEAPRISISSAGPASSSGHSKKKWLIALAVAAGAGTALALLHSSGGSSSTSGATIGAPSISVGHP